MNDLDVKEPPGYPMRKSCPFDPPPALLDLSRQAPVTRVKLWDGSHPWIVSRHDDVRALLRDPRVSADCTLPGYPDTTASAATRRKKIRNFMNMDGEEHATQRKALTAQFTVRRAESLRPRIQEITDALVDAMLAGPRPVDLVETLSLPVPSVLISEILGVPYRDRAFFQEVTRTIVSHLTTADQQIRASEELLGYLRDLVDRKAAEPAGDLVSRLVAESAETGRMTREQVAALAMIVLQAGHETTANMISLGTVVLLGNPDQLRALQAADDPALLENAVEELLRYLTIPHRGRRRVALEDLEIGGQLIRKGEGVIALIDVANRDESVFPHADAFDIARGSRRHVAFGFGAHQCLGQSVARVELQVVYRTLFRRIPALRLAVPAEELVFRTEGTVYGLESLPVTW